MRRMNALPMNGSSRPGRAAVLPASPASAVDDGRLESRGGHRRGATEELASLGVLIEATGEESDMPRVTRGIERR